MEFEISRRVVESDGGHCCVLVATPRDHVRVGRKRLQRLRRNLFSSVVDLSLLDQIRSNLTDDDDGAVFLIRGADNSGAGSWDFAEDLSAAEADELGTLLFRSHVPVYREMLRAGIIATIYADWPRTPLDAFRGAMDRLREELQDQRGLPEHPTAEVDYWIASNLVFHFGLDYEHVVTRLLPSKIELLRPRAVRIRKMLVSVPNAGLYGSRVDSRAPINSVGS